MPYKDPSRQARYQREWAMSRRQRWIDANGPCKVCGSNESLEVDHIRPEEKVDHRIWTWTRLRRERELKKCQVLCRACHIEKTASENRGEKGSNAKITAEQAREVHRLYAQGLTQVQVAERMPIRRSAVGSILRGETWPHILEELQRTEEAAA